MDPTHFLLAALIGMLPATAIAGLAVTNPSGAPTGGSVRISQPKSDLGGNT